MFINDVNRTGFLSFCSDIEAMHEYEADVTTNAVQWGLMSFQGLEKLLNITHMLFTKVRIFINANLHNRFLFNRARSARHRDRGVRYEREVRDMSTERIRDTVLHAWLNKRLLCRLHHYYQGCH